MFAAGAAMGFAPSQVEEMSLWQFNVSFDGWLQSKGIDQKENLLKDDLMAEFDDIVAGHA